MIHPVRDFRALARLIAADPVGWCQFQVITLFKAVLPHDRNNDFRKLTTTALFGTWIALTLGVGPGITAQHYTAITALVFMILGQQWELEKFRFGPFEVGSRGNDDD